jgi:hypothetical protein
LLLLHAVGVDASFFDAIAVLIAVVTLAQLPVGPSVGAAAAVLILGSDGVAAAAAAGVLLTVTGTVGGLCFAAWAGADKLWSLSRCGAVRRPARPELASSGRRAPHELAAEGRSAASTGTCSACSPIRSAVSMSSSAPASTASTVG